MATLTSEYKYLGRSVRIPSVNNNLSYYLLIYGKTVPDEVSGIHRVSILGRIASTNTKATFYHYTMSHSGSVGTVNAFAGTNKPNAEWSYINSSGATIGDLVYKTYTDIGEGSVDVDCTNGLEKEVELVFNWAMVNNKGDSYAAANGKYSVSVKAALSAIPRASSLSAVSDFYIGSTKELSINRNSPSFTHTISCIVSGEEKQLASGVGSSYDWNTGEHDLFLWKKVAARTDYITGTLRLYTYNGSTFIGYKDTAFKALVPTEYKGESVTPLLSCNILPDNSNIGSDIANSLEGKYVALNSKIRADFSGSSCNTAIGFGRTTVTVDGIEYSSSNFEVVTAPIKTSGETVEVVVAIEDASGRKTSRTEIINVMPYSLPTVVDYSCRRVQKNLDGNYEENQTGTAVRASGRRSFFSLDGANTCAVYYEAYEAGSSVAILSGVCVSAEETYDTFSFVIDDIVFDMEKPYVIYLYAKDKFGSGTKFPTTIPISVPTWHALAGGKGFSVGMITPSEGGFHVGYDAVFHGSVSGSILGMGKLTSIPDNTDVNTWMKFGSFSIRSNAAAETMVNLPSAKAGVFRVWSSVGDGAISGNYYYIIQEYVVYDNSAIYRRFISADEIQPWKEITI